MKKIGLLPRLIIGIILGIIIGSLGIEWLTKILVTFTGIFGNFLGYIIPLLIIGFVAPGIAELGSKAGKLLGLTAGIAYVSTIIAGTFAFIVASIIIPNIVNEGSTIASNGASISAFFEIEIPAIMGVMTALVTAFIFGLGMAAIKSDAMYKVMKDFQSIIEKVITVVIIPLLPIHISGIFAKMAYSGEAFSTLAVFGKVFIVVIAVHITYVLFQYVIAGSFTGINPFKAIKKMLPAYFTAIGTQSSAATIPVTVESAKNNGVRHEIAEFAVPLCATIHLAGSTITLTICAIAVMALSGITLTFGQIFPFILMLGVTMVAAPGVPGGAIMAALALLETMLGFSDGNLALMIALYMAQDSFGTAANVTGDGAIALVVNKLSLKTK